MQQNLTFHHSPGLHVVLVVIVVSVELADNVCRRSFCGILLRAVVIDAFCAEHGRVIFTCDSTSFLAPAAGLASNFVAQPHCAGFVIFCVRFCAEQALVRASAWGWAVVIGE